MRVQIATVDFDISGYLAIENVRLVESNHNRRATKRATLDGDVSTFDGGFAHGDRSLEFRFTTTSEIDSALKYITEYHSQVYVSTREGYFRAIPQYKPDPQDGAFTASILEKIA